MAHRRQDGRGPNLGLTFLVVAAFSVTIGVADERGRGNEVPEADPGATRPTLGSNPVDPDTPRLDFRSISRTPAARPALERRESRSFLDAHLMPRLSQQFEQVPTIHFDADSAMVHSGLHEWHTDTARFYAVKGARKAARQFLMEHPALSPVMNLVDDVRGQGRASVTVGGQGQQGGVRFGLRVARGIPAVEMRRQVGDSGLVRFRVGVLGSAGVEFTHGRTQHTRLFAGFNAADKSYRLNCRFSF